MLHTYNENLENKEYANLNPEMLLSYFCVEQICLAEEN